MEDRGHATLISPCAVTLDTLRCSCLCGQSSRSADQPTNDPRRGGSQHPYSHTAAARCRLGPLLHQLQPQPKSRRGSDPRSDIGAASGRGTFLIPGFGSGALQITSATTYGGYVPNGQGTSGVP